MITGASIKPSVITLGYNDNDLTKPLIKGDSNYLKSVAIFDGLKTFVCSEPIVITLGFMLSPFSMAENFTNFRLFRHIEILCGFIMKNIKFKISLVAFCLLLVFSFLQNEQKIYTQKMPDFKKAAVRNDKLQNDLRWTFGRKAQRGWYLYVPLIGQTLQIDSDADSAEFAAAVSIWQKNAGIKSDGIINKTTLFSFISYWQSRRIKPIVLADETRLLTAPISNFYDPTRNVELLKVEKETFAAYKKMIAAAIADKSLGLKIDEEGNLCEEESFLKLVSTYRSPAYQAGLRKKEPNASSAQIAFVSPHSTGRALDIYVGGEPVTTKDFNRLIQIETPVYKWLVKNAERFGFYPYFYEPWHWEYVPENSEKQ